MNYNVTIVRKPGSIRLYTSYQFNGQSVVRSTGLPDTPANRAHINKFIIPKYIAALVEGRDPTAVARKLSYYLDKVVENTKVKEKSESTQATYCSGAKKAIKLLGDRPINTYTTSDIEEMITKMKKKNSQRTIQTYLAPLSLAFQEAIKHNEVGVYKNPVNLADRPKRKKEEKTKPFTLVEVVKMIQMSTGEFRKFLILNFLGGTRHGEVLEIRRGDIDIENNLIMINKQYNIASNKPNAKLKTHEVKPEREIKVPSIIWELLGKLPEDPNLNIIDYTVMGNSKRSWIHKEWEAILEKTGIKGEGRTPYTTRHTFASLASSSKVNPLLVSDTLGHSGLKMIEEVYGSVDRSNENFEDFSDMIQEQISAQNIGKLAS